MTNSTVIVKVGTSSLTRPDGGVDVGAITKLAAEVADVRSQDRDVVIVTSGAITAGLPAMGFTDRPTDTITLQAAAAVGQSRLLATYDSALALHGLVAGQILLTAADLFDRRRYLHARDALQRLLALGIVPIVNENDAIADDEIRWGDNDRLAALVAHSLDAEVLILLTDTAGLHTADPRLDRAASLVEEIVEFDSILEAAAGGASTQVGSGGMVSKLAAARMASRFGVRTVIAAARRPGVVPDAIAGIAGVGTLVHARPVRLPARKLWIAFATPSEGKVIVDAGARAAIVRRGGSLLLAGVVDVEGDFAADAAVEVIDQADGSVVAKGLCRWGAEQLRSHAGQRTADLSEDFPQEVIHRDDLVNLG